jgi:hypothetical protein
MAPSLTKAFASIALLHAPLRARSSPPLPLSSDGQEWVSLSQNVEFLPASYDSPTHNLHAPSHDAARFLRRAQERVLSKYSSSQTFAEGASDSYYSEYATAWRLLGVYIDCSASNADARQQRQRRDRRHRALDEEEGADENEDEEEEQQEQEEEEEEEQYSPTSCPRYLLWEAVRTTKGSKNSMSEFHGATAASAMQTRN